MYSICYGLSNSYQMVRKEMGIKGSIIAACIDTITNTFFHQVFLILTFSLVKRIFPWFTIFHLQKCKFSGLYEFPFQKQQIGIIILRLFSKIFLLIFSYSKALIWTVGFFSLSIASDKHNNYSTKRSDKDIISYDRQIVFQVYMIQLSA